MAQSVAAMNLRDKYMAANVKWIQEHESKSGNDKVMLWAHNLHVSSMDDFYKYMGKNLKEMYGDEYYSIGFEFSRGSFTVYDAMYTKSFTRSNIDINDSEYLAYKFDKTQIPISFLDFNSASKSKDISEMLSKNQTFNLINAFYDESQKSFQYIPRNLFDGLIYIKETTPSKIK